MAGRVEEDIQVDDNTSVNVRTYGEFANLPDSQPQSPPYWWPDIGPHGNSNSFSFAHRVRRLGPVTILDADFHTDVWVNGG